MENNYAPKLSKVRVEKLRLRAFIGFIEWETESLQDVVISYSFTYDTNLASKTDDVQHAVNYKKINKEIIAFVDQKSFHLIETLAEKIFHHIQSSTSAIQDITVKVEKPVALRFTDNVMVEINSKDRFNSVVIALGSNINPEENFEKALNQIQQLGFIVQRTEFLKTKALKDETQPEFLNGAILFQTQKNLIDLKMHLKQIEAILGRVRTENKNAAREIDLDVTTFNGFIIDEEFGEFPFLVDFVRQLQPEIPF